MQLTNDQQAALTALLEFTANDEVAMVVQGYAGTGKTTLIREFLNALPDYQDVLRMVMPDYVPYCVNMTAPTHKATDVLRMLFHHMQATTFNTTQSLFGMRVHKDIRGNTTMVHSEKNVKFGTRALIILDEASYVDRELLSIVSQRVIARQSKIIFLGDPTQLTPGNTVEAPVFQACFPTVKLTEIVRQTAGSPLDSLIGTLRDAVTTKKMPAFSPVDPEIKFITDKHEAQQLLKDEFCSGNWHPGNSRILAWTNQRVVAYNDWIEKQLTGNTEFKEGQYYVNNTGVQLNNRLLPASTEVMVHSVVEAGAMQMGIQGDYLTLVTPSQHVSVFAPTDFAGWQAARKNWLKVDDIQALGASQQWVDLRNVYASTVNKAQGSTYNRVFVDMRDIHSCRNASQRARLMYVAASRAKEQVILFNF